MYDARIVSNMSHAIAHAGARHRGTDVAVRSSVTYAPAQVSRTLSYQGMLADSLGNPKPDGTYSFTFRLYQVASGGSALWTEVKTLMVKRGLFQTVLGDQVLLSSGLVFDRPYWLSVQVAAEPELSPRALLTPVGYSQRAAVADTALYA